MLSRYEETLPGECDKFGRFPVQRALAYRCGFLGRPILDEYFELLFSAVRRLWPSITRKQREFAIIPTHDVDNQFLAPKLRTAFAVIARIGADVVRRRSMRLAANTAASVARWKMSGGQHVEGDPFNVFAWLLQQSERNNVSRRYYFMTHEESGGPLAGRYDVAAPQVTQLIGRLAERGQETGIHPTSESYKDSAVLNAQVMKLRRTLDRLGLYGRRLGGR